MGGPITFEAPELPEETLMEVSSRFYARLCKDVKKQPSVWSCVFYLFTQQWLFLSCVSIKGSFSHNLEIENPSRECELWESEIRANCGWSIFSLRNCCKTAHGGIWEQNNEMHWITCLLLMPTECIITSLCPLFQILPLNHLLPLSESSRSTQTLCKACASRWISPAVWWRWLEPVGLRWLESWGTFLIPASFNSRAW